ncbi:hypothetical protein VTK56DRAFT_5219 [Thermocarpiscus australiensis]
MKLLEAFLLVAPAALAVAVPHPTHRDLQELNVVLQVHKVSSEASIAVWNADRSTAFGYKCNTSLRSGAFQLHPISFNVNEYGAGNLSIGSDNYTIHHDHAFSGGITCGRMHSATEILVTCSFTPPANLRLEPLDRTNLPACFSASTFHLASVLAGFESGSPAYPAATNVT